MQDNRQKDGVVVPAATVADSNAKKAKRRKTLPELPVYRASANMKFVIASMMTKAPRRLAKFYDEMLMTASEVSKSIGLADISRSSDDRTWYINSAMTLTCELRNDFTILLHLGVIGRDDDNKAKKLARNIIAQLVAWRGYISGEGVNNR